MEEDEVKEYRKMSCFNTFLRKRNLLSLRFAIRVERNFPLLCHLEISSSVCLKDEILADVYNSTV